MPPTPSPNPVDVFVHTAPSANWQVWAAFAPLIAALIAAAIAAATLSQRRRADNRAEWWRRAEWALDASMSDEAIRAQLGQQAINVLGKSKLATPEDAVLLTIGTEAPLEAADRARRPPQPRTDAIAPSQRPASVSPGDRKVQIAAARARSTLDKLSGDETPEWIIDLSKEKPNRDGGSFKLWS